MTTPIGEIPLSPALAEASPDSISELFNRDPEGISRTDIARLVESMRAQRARCEAAEGAGKPIPRQKKAKLASPVNPDDLGI